MAMSATNELDLTKEEIRSIMAEKAKELFQVCDTENKGFLTRRDLRKLEDELSLTTDQLEAVYDSLDTDGNGCLTFAEFIEGFGNFLGLQYEEQRRSSVYEDGLPSSPKSEDQFHIMMDHFGAYGVFEDQEAIKSLWERLKSQEPHLVTSFERCLGKISSEIKKTHQEYHTLESALKSRSSAHDEEVRHLYEEMETQIKQEKEQFRREEKVKERQIRAEMERELQEKESQLQEVIKQQRQLEQQLSQLSTSDLEIKQENEQLLQDKNELLKLLENSHDELQEQRSFVDNVRKKTKDERKDRVLQAVQITSGIALERETLVRQLDLLKDMNKKLRDDQDVAESRKSRSDSLDQSRLPLTKQGSVLSNYFSPTFSPNSRTSGSSFQFDDLETVDDDGVHYDDDVINNEVSNICNNNNNNSNAGNNKHKLSNNNNNISYDKTSNTTQIKLSNDVDNSKDVTDSKNVSDPSLNNKGGKKADIGTTLMPSTGDLKSWRSTPNITRSGSTQSSPSEQRRQAFIQYSKNTSAINSESSNVEKQSQDGGKENGLASAFVSVSLESFDRQSPIGANNSAGPVALDSQSRGPARVFKIVFVGDSGVGKSSFIHRFCDNTFTGQFCATIGVDFQVKSIVVGNQVVALQLWDTAGQERYRSITKQYFRKSDGIIVMYDVTSESSFRNVRQWMNSIEEGSEDNTVIMLLGNKTDLSEDDSRRPVKYKDGVHLADSYNCLFYETSAKQGKNIQECMVALASLLEDNEDKQMEAALKLQSMGKKGKKCCD